MRVSPLPCAGCCYSQHNSKEFPILFRPNPAKALYGEVIQRFSPLFSMWKPLFDPPLPHINKKAHLLRMRNPSTYSHPLRSGLPRRIICKYCRTSQRLGGIGYLYYKEACSPCRTQTGTEKAASPCVRPLVWWYLAFSGVFPLLTGNPQTLIQHFPA